MTGPKLAPPRPRPAPKTRLEALLARWNRMLSQAESYREVMALEEARTRAQLVGMEVREVLGKTADATARAALERMESKAERRRSTYAAIEREVRGPSRAA